MRYIRIIINPKTRTVRALVLEALRTTTTHPPIVDQNNDLFLQVADLPEMIGEIFNLGITYSELVNAGIEDAFDFEIVSRRDLPTEVAMGMN